MGVKGVLLAFGACFLEKEVGVVTSGSVDGFFRDVLVDKDAVFHCILHPGLLRVLGNSIQVLGR